ncbi:hypothetical protein HDU98_007130 [Podochytrium sp. JEL0797]|nr:hypothetical protein HDU98_007130 [Podochytrium sp. JEL0797]
MKRQNPDKVSKSHALEDENAVLKEKLQMAEKRITLLCETVEKVEESEALWADRAAVLEGKVIELRAEHEEMFRQWATADDMVTEFEWQVEDLKNQADEYRVQAQTWATRVVELTNDVTAGIREAARLKNKYTKVRRVLSQECRDVARDLQTTRRETSGRIRGGGCVEGGGEGWSEGAAGALSWKGRGSQEVEGRLL